MCIIECWICRRRHVCCSVLQCVALLESKTLFVRTYIYKCTYTYMYIYVYAWLNVEYAGGVMSDGKNAQEWVRDRQNMTHSYVCHDPYDSCVCHEPWHTCHQMWRMSWLMAHTWVIWVMAHIWMSHILPVTNSLLWNSFVSSDGKNTQEWACNGQKSLVNPRSTSNQSSKPCTVLQGGEGS